MIAPHARHRLKGEACNIRPQRTPTMIICITPRYPNSADQ
jgi:hypothetical protein